MYYKYCTVCIYIYINLYSLNLYPMITPTSDPRCGGLLVTGLAALGDLAFVQTMDYSDISGESTLIDSG